MFKFLHRLGSQAVLAECESELNRTAGAGAEYVWGQRDTATREGLIQKAEVAGLGQHKTLLQLGFLHRLLAALRDGVQDAPTLDAFIAAAKQLELEGTDGVKKLAVMRQRQRLASEGPAEVGRDVQNRRVYLRCPVEHKNKSGTLEVREDGLSFTGEVFIDIPWATVGHVAAATHTFQGYDYKAIAVQEGKRRTATKFVFAFSDSATYNCELIARVWHQFKTGEVCSA